MLLTGSDMASALRLIRKQPVLTATAVLALATGIAMATTGFALVEAVAYARLPFSGGERYVLIDVRTIPDARRADVESERFDALRAGSPALQHLGAIQNGALNLHLPSNEIALLRAAFITPESFAVLPYAPLLGRPLVADDGRPGAPPVVVVRESLWRRHFSANPAVVGTSATFDGVPRTIVGVMPDALRFPTSPEAWAPIETMPGARIFGVLRASGSESVASAQLMAASSRFEAAHGEAPRLRLTAMEFTAALSQGLDRLTAVLIGALILVLLVISANVANLVLTRSLARSNELAVRAALGATRGRLIAQIFVEVLALCAIAAALGLLASDAGLRWITSTATDLPFWVRFAITPRTVTFVLGATLLCASVAGLIPALRVTRRSLATTMAGTRISTQGFGRLSSVMVAAQITLSIALLNAALVMARGVAGYMEGASALPINRVMTARVTVPESLTPAMPARIRTALEQLPPVEVAGLASGLPRLSPPLRMTTVRRALGAEESAALAAPMVEASQGFLESLGARASAGRLFEPADFEPDANPVAIVNEPFVRRFLGGSNPIGSQIRVLSSEPGIEAGPWREIVGVVPDLGLSAGDPALSAGSYVPIQSGRSFYVSMRLPEGARVSDAAVRQTLSLVDPRIQVRDVIPLEEVGSEDRAVFAAIGAALSGLGGMTLLLSVMGVYAMLSFSVTQRTREIAIRSALGASRTRIVWAVTARSAMPIATGVLVGAFLAGVLVAARGIFAFRLPESSGPWGLAAVCAALVAAGTVATWLPARRALRITTSDALRAE